MAIQIDKNIIAVWKPKGPTSFGIIAALRRITGIKKIGHAGTLDPLAEGILVVALGREGTKQLATMVSKEKEYEVSIYLGKTSTTDDDEGVKSDVAIETPPTRSEIETALKRFIGNIDQAPPIFSALKIAGKPAYKLARKGKIESLPTRKITIHSIELITYVWPILTIRVTTGPGVYVRSLARDIGTTLKTGGYVVDLIRTRVGDYTKNSCENFDFSDLRSIQKQ